MKRTTLGIALVLMLAIAVFAQAPAVPTAADLPLHTERFIDRVLFAWAGDDMQLIRTVALSTARGVVVIARDFPYFKDRMLKMRDMDIHQNNVEAIWERIGGK